MLDVILLGTGGMMPLPRRHLTSLLARYNGHSILIDCGEGTQVSLRERGLSFKPVDVMCFTHYHADHISGLPGMLLAMANAGRTEPVTMIGPKGLARVAGGLRVIAPELPFDIEYIELSEPEQEISLFGVRIRAFRVKHSMVCYGYTLEIGRAGRFDAERAREQEIPLRLWNRLQKGETIEQDGRIFTPDMVLGGPRKGLKVTYCTDSRPLPEIAEAAKGADLFICEGMYGEPDKAAKAREVRHMTMQEAARLGAEAQPASMWLTHYSPATVRPEQYLDELREIFPRIETARDGKMMELRFEDEEDPSGEPGTDVSGPDGESGQEQERK